MGIGNGNDTNEPDGGFVPKSLTGAWYPRSLTVTVTEPDGRSEARRLGGEWNTRGAGYHVRQKKFYRSKLRGAKS